MAGSVRLAGTTLLERGEELARIQQAIIALTAGQGGVVLIQGAAGIGKSSLLHVLCEHAVDQGVQTLTAHASELEHEFSFGVVRQLLEARVVRASESERTELLTGAAGLAGPVLGLSGAVGDPFAALHGLYWLLANLALSGPVVLAIDDLQWADEPSLRWLMYLCRRLEDLPVLVAASTHPPRPGYPRVLAELFALTGVQILSPGPLSERAIAHLLCEGLGAQPERAFTAACAQATGGNPFVLRELIVELATDGIKPEAEQAAGLAQRVPAQVKRAVLARLIRLDPAVMRLAHAVAVLGENTDLRLAAALAELNLDIAAAAADALLAADLLDHGALLRFVHPLVRSAICEQLAPGARSRAHAHAAQLLIQQRAEPEQIAAQLLLCQPAANPDAVDALRAAAAAALARGAPETAISYSRRALAEPPPESVRGAVLAELGSAERIARDPAALDHLDQASQASGDPITRAQLAGQLINVLLFTGDLDRYLAVLQAGLDDLGDHDLDLTIRLRALKTGAEALTGRATEAPEITLDQLRELATRSSPASRLAQITLAWVLALRGHSCDEVAVLVERGLEHGRLLAEETCEAQPIVMAFWSLVYADDLDGTQALAEAVLVDARARGSVVGHMLGTHWRGIVALRRGELAEAEADLRASLELATEHGLTLAQWRAASLGLVLLERGELDQAAAIVEGVTPDLAITWRLFGAVFLEARGRVRLARGQRAQAIADLRHCAELANHAGLDNPNLLGWRSALALAQAPENPRGARELVETELELARRVGSARAVGIALRVCGLLIGGTEGIELLEQSVTVLEPTPMCLELAYSLTEWGAALRRAGARAAAREPLRRALDLAARCGATPLVERAREEALAAGARPRRPWSSGVHALTPSELRVARLAAQALGNREIAQALFITTKTVSDHLTSAYRKLNISSRDQLATAMK
jgi:DNA-binding CsgD family transcriptional regulator